MVNPGPWHRPGKWLANPSYWHEEALAERANMPAQIKFIDSTLSEGDDCVGHQLNWNTRLGLVERLDALGIGAITMPSHSTFSEEADMIRACRRLGVKAELVVKGPGIAAPLQPEWRAVLNHHLELGGDILSPIFKWGFRQTASDFSGDLSKSAVVDAIGESVSYIKSQGARVVPWVPDSMRLRLDTACLFFNAVAKAGADGVYVVDSRGNSTPLASRVFVRHLRASVGDCAIFVQHHNDLGLASANAMASVEGGANWIDCTVTGIGDRGGCAALEEVAVALEVYGVQTGLRLEGLYEVGCYVRDAFGAPLPPWKPLLGSNWNKEEGLGHSYGSSSAEATIGVAPEVVGRTFESVIGGKVLFGRERSSNLTVEPDDPTFVRGIVEEWGLQADEEHMQTILHRARAAVLNAPGRHYITLEEFRSICDGVLG